jgi:hypothetical protein
VHLPRAAVGSFFSYNTTKGRTFMFSPTRASAAAAEQACRDQGGHLVSYASMAEQQEVERFFIEQVRLRLLQDGQRRCVLAAVVYQHASAAGRCPAGGGGLRQHLYRPAG